MILYSKGQRLYSLSIQIAKRANFTDLFFKKASINNLKPEQLSVFKNGTGIALHKGAIQYADGIIIGPQEIEQSLNEAITATKKPILNTAAEEYLPSYLDFYKNLIG
jgi:starch synthase